MQNPQASVSETVRETSSEASRLDLDLAQLPQESIDKLSKLAIKEDRTGLAKNEHVLIRPDGSELKVTLGRDPKEPDPIQPAARKLSEQSIRQLTHMIAKGKGMWLVRMSEIGAIDEVKRCRATASVPSSCFTVYIPGPGAIPRFGHSNKLCNETQQRMYEIWRRDAEQIATAPEKAFTTQGEGLVHLFAKAKLEELKDLTDELPPSTSEIAAATAAEEAARSKKERERMLAEVEADAREMPSFDELIRSS